MAFLFTRVTLWLQRSRKHHELAFEWAAENLDTFLAKSSQTVKREALGQIVLSVL